MRNDRGMVLKTEGDAVHVVTRDGEFRRLPADAFDRVPARGEIVRLPAARPAGRRWARVAVAAAAAVALLFLALFSLLPPEEAPVVAYLEVEINPAVRLGMDAGEVVRTAQARDDDGQRLLQEVDVRGQTVYGAASALASAAADLGYLREGEDNVLLLTDWPIDEHPAPTTDLGRLGRDLETKLQDRGIGAVVSAVRATAEMARGAEERGLSLGREMVRKRAQELGVQIPPGLLRDAPLSDLPEQARVPAGVLFGRDEPGPPEDVPAPDRPRGPPAGRPRTDEDGEDVPAPPEGEDMPPEPQGDEIAPLPDPPEPKDGDDRPDPDPPVDVPRGPGGQ